MSMSDRVGRIQEELQKGAIDAIPAEIISIADRELKENVAGYSGFMRKIEHFSRGLMEFGIGVLGILFDLPYIDSAIKYGIKDLLHGAYKHFWKKDPYLVVSGSAIEGFNFDPSENVYLYVDGTLVSPTQNTTITTDANGYFKYETSLDAGVHNIVAMTSTKAAGGKFPV